MSVASVLGRLDSVRETTACPVAGAVDAIGRCHRLIGKCLDNVRASSDPRFREEVKLLVAAGAGRLCSNALPEITECWDHKDGCGLPAAGVPDALAKYDENASQQR